MENQPLAWIKKGRIFLPNGESPWMHSHAQVPRILLLPDRIRIYFATRPPADKRSQFVSQMGWVDTNRSDPAKIIAVSDQPTLGLGHDGEFDRFGVMPAFVSEENSEFKMYYTGWNRRTDVPYETAIGMAFSLDGGATFNRRWRGPIMAKTPDEPFLCNGPFIIREDECFHMFYASAVDWLDQDGRKECQYVIKSAVSRDGIDWERHGNAIITSHHALECQNAPTVIKIGNRYHMWFCHRHTLDFRNAQRGYRMGYAWSDDLWNWNRDDTKAGIEPSENGWDSEMVCYPGVYEVDGRILMFYCGNGFGREGFGWAELEQ